MASLGGQHSSAAAIEYLLHHVVLPPKLPQSNDYDATAHAECLLDVTIQALDDLKAYSEDHHAGIASFAIATIKNLVQSRDSHGDIGEGNLRKILETLVNGTNRGAIPLEVKAQNAGILISRSDDDIVFEFFELSPTNNASMHQGRLVRVFPGLASRIPVSSMQEEGMIGMIAATVAKMSTQVARDMQPTVLKAGKMHAEIRDTTHPGMVTDFLMNMTAAMGSTTDAVRISKNMREEVLWNDCMQPWRRSPLWLLTRVSLHLIFSRMEQSVKAPDRMFKAFMLFMLSRILRMAESNWKDLGSEHLHATSAKILRRLRKFEVMDQSNFLKPAWMNQISNQLSSAYKVMNNNWEAIMNGTTADINTAVLKNLQPEDSLDMQLQDLDFFLSGVMSRQPSSALSEFNPTGQHITFPAHTLPNQLSNSGENRFFILAAMEVWVAQHLPSWTEANRHDRSACGKLRRLMHDYHNLATQAYEGVPVSISVMYLVLLELWVACDSVACSLYQLVKDYDPEIYMDTFQCLSLPLRSQMQRLHTAERYVDSRRTNASQGAPSVYRDFGHASSFAVKYFDRSPGLQELLVKIERDATEKRQNKCNELAQLKRRYKDLMDNYNRRECEDYTFVYNHRHGYTRTVHNKYCSRCSLKREADALDIQIYEWPVSSHRPIAKATIFELRIPEAFSEWRDASMFLIMDVLESNAPGAGSPSNSYTLSTHRGLSSMLDANYSTRRIVPLSSVKPHSVTHRRNQKAVPNLEDEDVCLKNALQYGYYDSVNRVSTSQPVPTNKVLGKCMHRMPNSSKALERYLIKSPSYPDGVSSNSVIANLSECPVQFSIDEYKSFGMLPFGKNIFYSNILAQLAVPTLDFAKVETHCLLLQTILQAGPSNSSIERISHHVLTDTLFGNAMFEQLEAALRRVEGNWESWRAVAAFIQLALRTVSLTTSKDVRERGLRFLDTARQVSVKWLRRLKTRVSSSTDNEQRTELSFQAKEIALLGASTFDAEGENIDALLHQHCAISSLLVCSVVVRENSHMTLQSAHIHKVMIQAWQSMMHRIFPKLREIVLRDNAGLNDAVRECWSSYQPCSQARWNSMGRPNDHWLHITSGRLPVHINLLTAELLVNGLPMARLPSVYQSHPTYQPMFSTSMLEVAPTDEPGMAFSAKSTYHGYKLHFGMTGQDMNIVAINGDIRLDLLPLRLFRDRLPLAFVTNFIHWYDHGSNEVIFRPREHPWETTNANSWYLKRTGLSWRLTQGSNTLLDTTSKYAHEMSQLFQSLENPQHIHIIMDTTSKVVEIELPRSKFDFYLSPGDLEIRSRQYRGMCIDRSQRIGTLVGLSNKLVLRHTDREGDRLVLIPEGPVSYVRFPRRHHVFVTIARLAEMKLHAYSLDDVLGRVLDTGDIQSKLWLCYLHALTSHCLPDGLTGHTGTEAALTILNTAAIRSFDVLSEQNIQLLTLIAELSPSRRFYPAHERVMQQIEWKSNLPSLSQHGSFKDLVDQIFQQAKKMTLFYPKDKSTALLLNCAPRSSSDDYLHKRDMIRSSVFRTPGYGTEQYRTDVDTKYSARDKDIGSSRGHNAFVIATMVSRDQEALDTSIPNMKEALLRTHFYGAEVMGPNPNLSAIPPSSLRYDSKWLDEPSKRLRELWCGLHQSLSGLPSSYSKFDIVAWLSTSAYAKSADMMVIQCLVAFYRMKDLATAEVPLYSNFKLSWGNIWNDADIRSIASNAAKSFDESSEADLPKHDSETEDQHMSRIEALFKNRQASAMREFTDELKKQWPCQQLSTPASTEIDTYLSTLTVMSSINVKVENWYKNKCFLEYLHKTSSLIACQKVSKVPTPGYRLTEPTSKLGFPSHDRCFNMRRVFDCISPSLSQHASKVSVAPSSAAPCEPKLQETQPLLLSTNLVMRERLSQLCQDLETYAKSKCERDYVESLRVSCASLEKQEVNTQTQSLLADKGMFQMYLLDCTTYFANLNLALEGVLANHIRPSDCIAARIKQGPRSSPTFWLSHLNRQRYDNLPADWQTTFVQYGLAITHLHRAQRLVLLSDKPADLAEEIRQIGHTNWAPAENPETLLLEAESGIMVRAVQATIAEQMMQPPGDTNTVMQLNMGEGKSSTICPVVAAALADKKRLVRVIVAKPQSRQMLYFLTTKLGALLDRRIYHMPFSRDLRLTSTDANNIRAMYEECMANRGILLVQPEHLLSFKLMGLECLLTNQPETARLLLGTQQWFDQVSRDIVDESDENFSVKFELIYTMGSQRLIEFAPERWLLIQEILSLIPKFATQVMEHSPSSIEIHHGSNGRFPRIRILRDEGAEQLLTRLAIYIVDVGLMGLPIQNQPELREAILTYITQSELSAEEIAAVENSMFWTDSTRQPLLLVRGLIACGVLRFVLTQKRWRVNYGLDPSRTPSTKLAVPYKAKDSPSPRSEFSHPDVVILLTTLSFYYGGLDNDELFDSFVHLLKSDQAAIEYDEWVRTAAPELPNAFQHISGVSIKDRVACVQDVFPHLRYSRATINYYLASLVLPKAMKEFPSKLSASGWDLGAIKTHPITGFSGTNDTMHVLPLTVNHLDLPSQNHTNALVLGYLLQDETSVEPLPPRIEGTDAEHLLTVINAMTPEVRVILDVGAFILEMNNEQVARSWLSMRKSSDTQAVVFFSGEQLSVLDVAGRIESLQTSPFAKQLDQCLVYLDEAHTRGTDLKLPRNYRAAVTLGANLTKDRLVQACMRLRKLGKGQSVSLITPQEISMKIRQRTGKPIGDPIQVADVLCWCIGETWIDLARSMPLWAVQGHRFEIHKHLLQGAETTMRQAKEFLEDEARSLEDRYKPKTREDSNEAQLTGWDLQNPNIDKIVARCRDFEAMGFNSASLQEEQERELSPEIEEERQIERPAKMSPETHKLDPDLVALVRTGRIPDKSKAVKPAFQALQSTSAARLIDLTQFPSDLIVTEDFMRTVKIPAGSNRTSFISDAYQRPVQWVVSVPSTSNTVQALVILSPFEANALLPDFQKLKQVTLHLFSPCCNASFSPIDRLELFNVGRAFSAEQVPRSLTMQMNLFSGSLYLRSYTEYGELCDFLGLLRDKVMPGQRVFADGFVTPPSGTWGLKRSPVPFLRALLMKIRKEGEGIEKTIMGRVLSGARLEESDFEGKD